MINDPPLFPQSPSINDTKTTFNRRIEGVFVKLPNGQAYANYVTNLAHNRLSPAIALFNSLDTSEDSSWQGEVSDVVIEANQHLWDQQNAPLTQSFMLQIAESEAISAKNQALFEIQQAVDNCECTPDPGPEVEGGPYDWYPDPDTYTAPGPVSNVSWSYQGNWLAASVGGQVFAIQADTGELFRTLSFNSRVLSLHFSPDEAWLYIGTQDGKWIRANSITTATPHVQVPGPFKAQTIDPVGSETIILTLPPNPAATRYSLPNWELIGSASTYFTNFDPYAGLAAAFSHDNTRVAMSGNGDYRVVIVNRNDGSLVPGVPSLSGYINQVAWAKDDSFLMICQSLPYGGINNPGEKGFMVLDIASMTWVTIPEPPSANVTGMSLNEIGGVMHCALSHLDPGEPIIIYNTETWVKDSVAPIPNGGGLGVSFEPGGIGVSLGYNGGKGYEVFYKLRPPTELTATSNFAPLLAPTNVSVFYS